MWRHLGGGLGGEKKIMTTPRLIRFRFNDTQKPMDVIFDFVVIINPHVYFFFFPITSLSFSVTTSVHFHSHFFPFSSRQWYAAPITEEKMSHHGQFSYDLCTYVYTHVYTLANALGQKYISCSFPFLCQSRRGTPGVRDENRETSERKCVREI